MPFLQRVADEQRQYEVGKDKEQTQGSVIHNMTSFYRCADAGSRVLARDDCTVTLYGAVWLSTGVASIVYG